MEGKATTDRHDELVKATRLLVEYIRKNCTPETTAIVTGISAEILSVDINVQFNDDWD